MFKPKNKIFHYLKNKIYFIPGYFSLIALILSITVIILDNKYAGLLYKYIPSFIFTSSNLAETILSTLAGSLFGMITISFSTIMVVLTMYSSQFSPRTMQDFLQNHITLKILGIFTGGFIYSILTLLFLREGAGKNSVFSAGFGVIIAIICLAYFIFFIHHVANSVQVNKLVKKLRDEIIAIVDNIEKRNDSNDQIKNIPPKNIDEILKEDSKSVYAKDNGYIKLIYDLEITELADKNNIIIKAEKMIGDYVTENSKVFSIYKFGHIKKEKDNSEEYKEQNNEIIDIGKQLLNNVIIDNERSKENDIEFGMLKLTEVALRAISPGINDPNTAIFCINQLGWVLSRIAVANIENTYYYNEENEICFIMEDISFDELLYKTFYQLRYYGSRDVSVAGAILDALLVIAEGSPEEIKQKVWDFSDYILNGFDKKVLDHEDKKFLNHKIYNLAVETNNKDNTENFFQV
ncbi:MAG: DUF2254 domain-containing protein [Bacillota bacterium]